ncbi:Syntaxin pep12 [Mycena venus]|uniref:Syntaxin pep12 n=1 Tax=Mycena venus TaxID=2733690 RepID=A0A8H6Z495_9AGAR|nr:Syntaxin pep12 [Mycena venus]
MSFQDLVPPKPSTSSSSGDSSLSIQIFKINANVQGIRSLSEQVGTPRDSSTLRTRLRDLTEATRALVHRASEEMRALAAQAPHTPVVKKLVSDLDASVRNFQAAQKFSVGRQRANVVPARPSDHHQTASEPLVDVSEMQSQSQMQAQVVYATEDAFREAEIRERQTAILELETGMADVAQIIRNLADIVERQGEEI